MRLAQYSFQRSSLSRGTDTREGLDAAWAARKERGRPEKLDSHQRSLAIDLYDQKKHGVDEICRTVGISKPTLYAYIKTTKGEGA